MYTLKKYENGFEYIEIQNSVANAKIALQGAHIFEYAKKDEKNLLWLSDKSAYERGVAIRGGIPLCWPRFGSLDKTLQQHGFARVSIFKLLAVRELDKFQTEVLLQLQDTEESREVWNHKFTLEVKIVVTDTLNITIKTTNLDEKDLMITQALHTYFRITNIQNIVIKGLENKFYYDTVLNQKLKENSHLHINSEVDRVYIDTDDEILLIDKKKTIKLKTIGSESTIVWNPWIEKCSKMSYISKDAYKKFVCIESANAFDDYITIKSKKSHTLSLDISF